MKKRKDARDLERGKRFWRVANELGPLVGAKSMNAWAVFLGQEDPDDFYNWGKGHKPAGDVARLASIFEPLRLALSLDPRSLAGWVFKGVGEMPRGGSTVPNVSAPSSPAPQETHGELVQRTPSTGTPIESLSHDEHAQKKAKTLDAEIARPMIRAALDGDADKTKTLEALWKLLTGVVVLAGVSTGAAPAPVISTCAPAKPFCSKPDNRQKRRRKSELTKGRHLQKAPPTSRRKISKPALTVHPSTALTHISQDRSPTKKTG